MPFFKIVRNGDNTNAEWVNKCGISIQWNIIHPYKRDECRYMLSHGLTLKTRLSERSQTQEAAYYLIPFIWNVQNKKFIGTELGARDCGRRRRGVTANGWVSLWGDNENILEEDRDNCCTILWTFLKTTELYPLKWWFLLYVSYPFSSVARPPCPSPTLRVYSNSSLLSWWCHPSISSSVVPFSSHFHLSQH